MHTLLDRFHDVEPQEGLEALPPHRLSDKVLSANVRLLPPPTLNENTLVLSEGGVVGHRDGRPYLMFRWARLRAASASCCVGSVEQSKYGAIIADASHLIALRVGDTYPGGQVEDVQDKAFLYRWKQRTTAEGEEIPYSIKELALTPAAPTLRSGCKGNPVSRESATASDGIPRTLEGITASVSAVRVMCEQK